MLVSAARIVCLRSATSGRPSLVRAAVGGVGELAHLLGGDSGLADGDPRLGERGGDLGQRSARLRLITSTFSRIAGDRILVAVREQSVSRSVSVDTRSSSSGALLSSWPSAPGLVGITGTP